MSVAQYTDTLREGEVFVVVEVACGHGSLVCQGPYIFQEWEQEDLIAVVSDTEDSQHFLLGMSAHTPGVDDSVTEEAAFVCSPDEFQNLKNEEQPCGCQ